MSHSLAQLTTAQPCSLSVSDLADLFTKTTTEAQQRPRLVLPPIQRSLVWRNTKIVDYWDSLIRGFPAGLMMVRAVEGHGQGNVATGETIDTDSGDFELFDGQQRLMTILLGKGLGVWAKTRCLWIDIGIKPALGVRRLELRINSSGQPFGYDPEKPNQKFPVGQRSDARERYKDLSAPKIFDGMKDGLVGPLLGASAAVPLSTLIKAIHNPGLLKAIADEPNVNSAKLRECIAGLEMGLASKIIVQRLELKQSDAPLFFQRLGQGGEPLSNDELTYSLIKMQHPSLRQSVDHLIEHVGQLASATDLVLGILRASFVSKGTKFDEEWKRIGRPTPETVRLMESESNQAVKEWFCSWIDTSDKVAGKLTNQLQIVLSQVTFKKDDETGIPAMLLARLPRDLVDVIVYISLTSDAHEVEDGRNVLIAFVLYWLVFVHDDGKAALQFFRAASGGKLEWNDVTFTSLITALEADGCAWHAPRGNADWSGLREEVKNRGPILAEWNQRFACSETTEPKKGMGLTLRMITTDRERQKRILMWIQRKYLSEGDNYNPVSIHDDDLPFDLDHLVPGAQFRFNWRNAHVHQLENVSDRFNRYRRQVGESLGNLRWLESSANRSRQDGKANARGCDNVDDQISDYAIWNDVIEQAGCSGANWSPKAVEAFQRIIDLRSLDLIQHFMVASGVNELLQTSSPTV